MKKILFISLFFLILCSLTSIAVDIKTDLVNFWDMETLTNGGDLKDLQGINNGTIDGANATTGKIGGAYDFERDDTDTVRIDDMDFSSGYTLNAWFNPESLPASEAYYFILGNQDDAVGLALYNDLGTQKVCLYHQGLAACLNETLQLGQWYMITGTWNGSGTNTKLWLNGTLKVTGGIKTGVGANGNPNAYIGSWNDAVTHNFDGIIDDTGFWNREKSASDIDYLWNNGAGKRVFVPQNLSLSLIYPSNTTIYYGDYNGSILIDLSDVDGSATCSINDSRWTLDTTSPFGNGTVQWINNTSIDQNNISIFINCTDDSHTSNLSFWFYLETILDINVFNEETESSLNGSTVLVNLISDNFANNYTITTGNLSIQSLNDGSYTIEYSADGFDKRLYYLTVVTGKKYIVNLYLLNSSTSTLIIPTIINQLSEKVSNVTIKMQRHYVSSNSFVTVSMTRTNDEGEGIIYADIYDVNYKLLFEYEGSIIGEEQPAPFTKTEPTYRINLEDNAYTSWVMYDDVISNVTFIKSSGTIYARFIYDDVTNNLRKGCFKVTRITPKVHEVICNNCTSSNSATLTCVINSSLDGNYKAIGLIDTNTENSWYDVAIAYTSIKTKTFYDFGEEGIFNAVIILGTVTLMSITTISGSVTMLIISYIATSIIGLIQGVTIGTIMFMVVTFFTLIFIVRKGME